MKKIFIGILISGILSVYVTSLYFNHKLLALKKLYDLSLLQCDVSGLETETGLLQQLVDKTSQKTKKQHPVFQTNIPIEYFDEDNIPSTSGHIYLDSIITIDPPIEIANPDTSETVDEPFEEVKRYWNGDRPASFSFFDPVDVDTDGVKEKIYYVPYTMNHGVASIWIIKGNRVIFKSSVGANKWFEPSKSNNGFYLSEEFDVDTAWNVIKVKTRYVYEDGKFVPVWSQNTGKVRVFSNKEKNE